MASDVVHPICCTQKIAVYETKTRFYLVGSNNAQTKFRVLKIDRTEPTELSLIDDKVEYDQSEIRNLLQMIDGGNRAKNTKGYEKGIPGLLHRGSAFGIVGFVKFLEGYYIVLISKRRRVALIGGHTIYKIDDTVMIRLANEQIQAKLSNPDEAKYLRIFQNVDLSSNFYFSYSYDLTHNLQYNLAPDYGLPLKYTRTKSEDEEDEVFDSEDENGGCQSTENLSPNSRKQSSTRRNSIYDATHLQKAGLSLGDNNELDNMSEKVLPGIRKLHLREELSSSRKYERVFRGHPCEKFVWNMFLLENFKSQVHSDWLLYVTHGFIGQSNISVYGKPIYVTLIARRSNQFAGTRFLKRGANDEGFAANDVETEQIAHDASLISLRSGRYTSYTQIRGSAPFYWSQDTSQGRIVPKPQILVDRSDPYFGTASLHFNSLLSRFGGPIVIVNLVKKKEKKPHEQILSDQLKQMVDYLNQFLPQDHHIDYIAWDMARVTKSKEVNVIERLAEIAEKVMKTTGFFHSGQEMYCNKLRVHPKWVGMQGIGYNDKWRGLRQAGIVRVNCVDCLDRTNTAQFMIGKCALGFQLYALGVTESPVLEFDTDAVRMLEELFEAHGDTLALQYGGSQMVHRIRSYRKISPWTSHSRDIMQTVSRYYSNAFTDADKQQALNLFLGVFIPKENEINLWDLATDYYLHHSRTINSDQHCLRPSYTKWCDDTILDQLPAACSEGDKSDMFSLDESMHVTNTEDNEISDLFAEYYRLSELTEFDQLYARTMPTSSRDFMPSFSSDPSPFVVRARGRTVDPRSHAVVAPRKVIGGSPSSLDDVSSEDESSSDDDSVGVLSPTKCKRDSSAPFSDKISFQDLLPTTESVYGFQLEEPDPIDLALYERFSELNQASRPAKRKKISRFVPPDWSPISTFAPGNTKCVNPPIVDLDSLQLYEGFVAALSCGPKPPKVNDLNTYRDYVAQMYM